MEIIPLCPSQKGQRHILEPLWHHTVDLTVTNNVSVGLVYYQSTEKLRGVLERTGGPGNLRPPILVLIF